MAAHTLTLRTAGVAYAVPAALLQASVVRMARAETLRDPTLRQAVTTSSLALSIAFGVVICLALTVGAETLAQGVFHGSPAGLAAAEIAIAVGAPIAISSARPADSASPGSGSGSARAHC